MELYVREVKAKYKRIKTKVNIMNSPQAVWMFLKPKIANDCRESFYVLGLDNKNTLVMFSLVSVGTVSETVVHPREVFLLAVREICSGIIVAHNHPSGHLTPSSQDIKTTERLVEAGKILGIPVMDHIIITLEGYYSFKENGHI